MESWPFWKIEKYYQKNQENSDTQKHGRETKSVVHIIKFCMSYVSVPVRTALKFGRQTVSFQFCNLKFGTYTIICSAKLLSFSINYFYYHFLII